MQVHFDAAAFHDGQSGRFIVELGTGSDEVKMVGEVRRTEPALFTGFEFVLQVFMVQDPLGCAEAFVRHNPTAKLLYEVLSERHRVAFNHDVKILAGQLQ